MPKPKRLLSCAVAFSYAVSFGSFGYAESKEAVRLQYKLKAGETISNKVIHEADTMTRMSAVDEVSSARTTSIKTWEVKSVDKQGNMQFVYRVDSVEMEQSIGDAEPLVYNSSSAKEVPDIFKHVAETIAKPLATITIDPSGEVLERDKDFKLPVLGMGELTIPLPKEPVVIGAQWEVPRDLRVRLDDGSYKTIKVRELYILKNVSAGVATIAIETQPLTPVTDPGVESQLIQQLSRGTIHFDIDRGRMISKKLEWDEEVVGFRGPETMLRYDAKFEENLLTPADRAAALKKVVK